MPVISHTMEIEIGAPSTCASGEDIDIVGGARKAEEHFGRGKTQLRGGRQPHDEDQGAQH
jgi:hypothetical protein